MHILEASWRLCRCALPLEPRLECCLASPARRLLVADPAGHGGPGTELAATHTCGAGVMRPHLVSGYGSRHGVLARLVYSGQKLLG